MDIDKQNLHRAHLLIDTLFSLGVTYFCVAPGSRSTPLAIAIHALCQDNHCVHFDERGLAFHALGYAKAKKKPVAILVTSGTAVANLLPAVMEAHLSRIPLILLTADRPPELRNCGANQTTNQVNIFSSFTKECLDLAFQDPQILDKHISSYLAHIVQKAITMPCGPVHINCMIREPLFSKTFIKEIFPSLCRYEPSQITPGKDSFAKWAQELSMTEKGVIVLGSDAIEHDPLPFLNLAKSLGWPILSDVLSGGRCIGQHTHHIEHADLFLKTFSTIQVDAVLHIGDRLVSKILSSWLKKQEKAIYFQVCNHFSLQDPEHQVLRRMTCPGDVFSKTLSKLMQKTKNPLWLNFWQRGSKEITKCLSTFFKKNKTLSEPAIAYSLRGFSHFFLSNSLPIRDADLFLFAKQGTIFLTANRGVSGIDGNIATATGVAVALNKPLVALLGDLATLHDLNSLALIKNCKSPLICIILNNQGGGIFSFLPIAEKKELFEEFMATEHSYSFELIAKAFSIDFFSITSLDDWLTLQKDLECNPRTCFVECKTNRSQNVSHHEEIYHYVQDHLCSLMQPLEMNKIKPSSFCTVS